MRAFSRFICCLGLIATMVVAAPASAESLFGISGTVSDGAGRPLPRVRVEIDSQIVFTDDEGHYEVDVFGPGSRWVTLTRADLVGTSTYVNVSLEEPKPTKDFTLSYRVTASYSPSTVVAPGTTTVTADTWASGDVCMSASHGEDSTELVSIGDAEDGSHRFSGTIYIPVETPLGARYYYVEARECTTGAALGNVLRGFLVAASNPPPPTPPDTTPPTIEIVSPKQGHMSYRTDDLGASPTGDTMVIGTARFKANVKDNKSVRSVYFELFDSSDSLTWHCDAGYYFNGDYMCDEEITFFSSNSYTFRVTAKDPSGNTSVREQKFVSYLGPAERDRLIEL